MDRSAIWGWQIVCSWM